MREAVEQGAGETGTAKDLGPLSEGQEGSSPFSDTLIPQVGHILSILGLSRVGHFSMITVVIKWVTFILSFIRHYERRQRIQSAAWDCAPDPGSAFHALPPPTGPAHAVAVTALQQQRRHPARHLRRPGLSGCGLPQRPALRTAAAD